MICVPLLGRDPARRDRPIRTGRRDKPIIQLPSVALRVAVIVGVAAVMFGIVFFRLWFLQILSGQEFVAQANDNRLTSVKIVAQRGYIVDRNGERHRRRTAAAQAVGIRLMDVPKGTLDEELAQLAPQLQMKPGDAAQAHHGLPEAEHRARSKDGGGRRQLQRGGGRVGQRVGGTGAVVDVTTSTAMPGRPKKGSLVDLTGLTPAGYNGLYAVNGGDRRLPLPGDAPADPGADATTSADSLVTQKKWISFFTWPRSWTRRSPAST